MNLTQYINNLNTRYKSGNATEHTYRTDLQQFLENLAPYPKDKKIFWKLVKTGSELRQINLFESP